MERTLDFTLSAERSIHRGGEKQENQGPVTGRWWHSRQDGRLVEGQIWEESKSFALNTLSEKCLDLQVRGQGGS